MPLTPFTKMLAEYFIRQQERDLRFSKASLAKSLGVHRATVGRWLEGSVTPEPDEQIRVLYHLGILGENPGVQMANARVAGRIYTGTGSAQMVEQPLENSIPVPHLEYLLNQDPLWSLTTGDPFLLRLDGELPGYEMMDDKVVARRPRKESLLEIPSGTLAIARLMEERDPKRPDRVDWRYACIRIHRLRDTFPYLEYSAIGISGVYCVMARDAFEIVALVFPYEAATDPAAAE